MQRRLNPVFRSLNAPFTLLGAERKLFFFALVIGAAVFNLLHTFLGGLFMFALLYWFARWATKTDPPDPAASAQFRKGTDAIRPDEICPAIRFGACVMFKLRHALNLFREAGSLNERINLFGFMDDHPSRPKAPMLESALRVRGVDYECLDSNGVDGCTKRLESAFQNTRRPLSHLSVPLQKELTQIFRIGPNQNPVVNPAAIENRISPSPEQGRQPF